MGTPDPSTIDRHYSFSMLEHIGRHVTTFLLGWVGMLGSVAIVVYSMLAPGRETGFTLAIASLVVGVLLLVPFVLGYVVRVRWVQLTDSVIRWQVKDRVEERPWEDVRYVTYSGVDDGETRRREAWIGFATRETPLEIVQSFHKFKDAVKEIMRRSYPARRQAIQEEYETGRAQFGPITVTPTGISRQSQEVSWDAVARVLVSNGHVTVSRADSMWSIGVDIRHLPNSDVLFQLMEEHGCRVELGRG
jgi:hypothetical protein